MRRMSTPDLKNASTDLGAVPETIPPMNDPAELAAVVKDMYSKVAIMWSEREASHEIARLKREVADLRKLVDEKNKEGAALDVLAARINRDSARQQQSREEKAADPYDDQQKTEQAIHDQFMKDLSQKHDPDKPDNVFSGNEALFDKMAARKKKLMTANI